MISAHQGHLPVVRMVASGFNPEQEAQVRRTLNAHAIVVGTGPCDAMVMPLPAGVRQFDRTTLADEIGEPALILLALEDTSQPYQRFHAGDVHLIAPPWREELVRTAIRECIGRAGLSWQRDGSIDVVHHEMPWGSLSVAFASGTQFRPPSMAGDATECEVAGERFEWTGRGRELRLMLPAERIAMLMRTGGIPAVATFSSGSELRSGDVLVMAPVAASRELLTRTMRLWAAGGQRRPATLAMTLANLVSSHCLVAEVR